MFAGSKCAAMAALMLGLTANAAGAEDAITPKGLLGFESAPAGREDPADFGRASQISTFDLSYGASQAAPGLAMTAQGHVDWAKHETLEAAAARIRAREGSARGIGLASFDGSSRTGGMGWGLGR